MKALQLPEITQVYFFQFTFFMVLVLVNYNNLSFKGALKHTRTNGI